jgi:hypothetical protein
MNDIERYVNIYDININIHTHAHRYREIQTTQG